MSFHRLATLIVALGLFAAACGDGGGSAAPDPTTPPGTAGEEPTEEDEWAAVVAAAEEEGEALLYGSPAEEVVQRLAAAFNEKYPNINLEAARVVDGDSIARVEAEYGADSVVADVIVHGGVEWFAEKVQEGWFVPPEGPASEAWPAEHYETGITSLVNYPYLFAYNTDIVTDPPEDYGDLLKEEYRGRLAFNEPRAGTVYAIFQCYADNAPMGMDFHRGMADLDVRFIAGTSAMVQAAASGEIAISPVSYAHLVEELKAAGAPLEWVIPSSGTCVYEGKGGILSEAPHPNAARVVMDFMMSPEGQAILNQHAFSVIDGVPETLDVDPSLITFFDYENWDLDASADAFMEIYGR